MYDAEDKLFAAQEALVAYATVCPCPGFVIEPGVTTGCDGSADDCPTCHALRDALGES
jgi:hypothetical protein